MTSVSIVLMIPTLIASFYGMNVDVHLDEWPHAFAAIVVFSIILSVLAFWVFRRIKWF
jgi:magnesium transporter